MSGSPIDYLCSVRVTGPDARPFLQSQLTRDLETLNPDAWRLSAWCDPKGRVLTVMLLRRHENDVDLVLPEEGAEVIRQRLVMYSIGRDVELAATGPVSGGRGPVPPAGSALSDDPRRWLSTTAAGGEPDPESRAADIRAGIPWTFPEVAGRHLPQFLGLEDGGGVSYTKGCYPGQEVIARLHHRGRVKKRLAGFRSVHPPAPGEPLTDDTGAAAGEVLYATADGDAGIGLAVVPAALAEGVAIHVSGFTGRLTSHERL